VYEVRIRPALRLIYSLPLSFSKVRLLVREAIALETLYPDPYLYKSSSYILALVTEVRLYVIGRLYEKASQLSLYLRTILGNSSYERVRDRT